MRIPHKLRLVVERAHVVEPASQMRILLGVHVLVHNNEQLSISVGGSETDAVGVVEEVLVKLFNGLENYALTQEMQALLIWMEIG